jgi:hypothetical protein
MVHNDFYIVYFDSDKKVKTLNDFLNNTKCHIKKSGPYVCKTTAKKDSMKYGDVCIIYCANNQTYLNDAHHLNYDQTIIRVLALWAKSNIKINLNPKRRKSSLETIIEEDEEDLDHNNKILAL